MTPPFPSERGGATLLRWHTILPYMHRMQLIDGVRAVWGWCLASLEKGQRNNMYICMLLYMAHITFLLFAIRTNHRVTLRYTYLSHKIVFFTCSESHHIYMFVAKYNRSPDGCWLHLLRCCVYVFGCCELSGVLFREFYGTQALANTTFYVMIYI